MGGQLPIIVKGKRISEVKRDEINITQITPGTRYFNRVMILTLFFYLDSILK